MKSVFYRTEKQREPEAARFRVCLGFWREADCGSVADRWEELQPDAGR